MFKKMLKSNVNKLLRRWECYTYRMPVIMQFLLMILPYFSELFWTITIFFKIISNIMKKISYYTNGKKFVFVVDTKSFKIFI